MLNDLSIKTKLAAGFGAIVAIILILLTLAYTNFSKLSRASEWDRHTLQVLLEANQIETALVQIQTSTRGFMLTGEESLTAPIAAEEEAVRRHHATITAMTADNPEQQQRLKRLAPMMDTWIEHVIHPLLDKRRALNQQVGVSQQVATPADVLNGAKTVADARALLREFNA
ncbi:MAG TPA: CHASE3 domain-containing protein, partial [Duganella sp.]|nr:CHASE3 domain-containing protein [Duganella sp.]